ncbi:MAG: DUF2029 domain-containing protein [Phycisphaerae bacterium]|nr:DUF2029 domain-containing protein [Phycisphaerae bacterium]
MIRLTSRMNQNHQGDSSAPAGKQPPPAIQRVDRAARLRVRIIRILAVLFACYCVGDAISFLRAWDKRKPTLKRFLPYAAEIGSDDRLYQKHPDYIYPPFFLTILKPLAHVPAPVAALIWQTIKYGCIIAAFSLSWRMFRVHGPRFDWVRIVSVIVAARFIHSDLRHGNINLFIAAMIIGAGVLLVRRQRFLCGLLIALAACIKVTPGLWALYLLYKRDVRALAGCWVGALLALVVVPGAIIGFERNHALLMQWRSHVIDSFVEKGTIDSDGMNQSLSAVMNRWLGHSEVPGKDRVAILQCGDSAIRLAYRGAALGLLALTFWIARAGPGSPYDQTVLDWALLAPVSLALSGLTWTGHFCLLIPGIVGAFAWIERSRGEGRRDPTTIALAAAAAAMFILTTDILTETGREWTSRMGAPLIGAMILYAALARLRRSRSITDTDRQ